VDNMVYAAKEVRNGAAVYKTACEKISSPTIITTKSARLKGAIQLVVHR
jgi:hypothetical protein